MPIFLEKGGERKGEGDRVFHIISPLEKREPRFSSSERGREALLLHFRRVRGKGMGHRKKEGLLLT